MTVEPDVLIVGAGPAGSTLAVDLARRGVSVRIVDKAIETFPGSRAKGVQPRSLEVFEDLGVLNEILASGSLYPPLGIHLGPFTIAKRMFKRSAQDDRVPYPDTWLIPQFTTDRIIQSGLAQYGLEVEYGTELVGFVQDASGVTVQIEGPLGSQQIRARYLVGADGGSSFVRRMCGIAFEGETDESDRMILADCRIEGLKRDRWHVWPGRKGRFAGACPLPQSDLFQVMIRLQPGEEPEMADAALDARFRKQTRSSRLHLTDIGWKSVFRPNIRLAQRYREGRVFLVGDAAHVHTPMGAQGLNTGVQDAYNLGWKLGQALAGAPDTLLDTYEDERRPVAAGVLGLSTAKYEALNRLDPASIRRGGDEKQLGISYAGGVLAPRDRGAHAKIAVGDRAPDVRFMGRDGSALRLFELMKGAHFTLVAVGDAASAQLASIDWPTRGAGLKRVALDGDVPGAQTFDDEAGAFRAAYGIAGDALVLIRPDGYVGRIVAPDQAVEIARFARLVAPRSEAAGPQQAIASIAP